MVRRFANLLLVLLVVANQGVSLAFAHSHDDNAANHATGAAPHVHVGEHSHHGHDHHHHGGDHSHSEPLDHSDADDQTDLSLDSPVADHDSDAVYCGESFLAARSNSELTVGAIRCACGTIRPVCDDCMVEQRPRAASAPPLVTSTCPVYLRTLSLRI